MSARPKRSPQNLPKGGWFAQKEIGAWELRLQTLNGGNSHSPTRKMNSPKQSVMSQFKRDVSVTNFAEWVASSGTETGFAT